MNRSIRRFLQGASAALLMSVSFLPVYADPLDQYVVAFETYQRDGDPSEDARANDRSPNQWGKVTPEYVEARAAIASDLLLNIQNTDTSRSIDKAIMEQLLHTDIDAYIHDLARIPFTGDWGFHAEPVFAAMQTRLQTVEEANAWIARLDDVPRYFDEHKANMRRGVETGWTAHADPMNTMRDQVVEQAQTAIEQSPFFLPFDSLGPSITPIEAVDIRERGKNSAYTAIKAYRDLLTFIDTEYAPKARAYPGIGTLSGGKDVYLSAVRQHTAGAGFSPEDIHALGKSEVVRIRAEMDKVIASSGFEGNFSEYLEHLRTSPEFYAETPEELLRHASAISKRLDAILPKYFTKLPRLTYGVSPVPASIAPGYTTGRYLQGDVTTGRAGVYLVNTYALDQRPVYELPALSAHEAVPGHHLQIALAQEMESQPRFRQEYYATAFGEGWGLYAERIAGEAGLYETPAEKFGALSYEMWRACRLVADTGLHWYGWSREQAETCFFENTALAPLNIKTEVTRYIGWPGQATAYKVGELKIRKLRQMAEDALGDMFDIRAFHDAVLAEGAVPLNVLEHQIDAHVVAHMPPAEAPAP